VLTGPAAADPARAAELGARLASVRAWIARACESAGRPVSSVTLVVVTKTWPSSDVRLLAGLGVRDFGENRDQEASVKAAETADLDIDWHFVGRVQTNKARSIARYADVVHAVDSERLAQALDRAAGSAGRRLGALVQVNLDARASDPGPASGAESPAAPGRAGVRPDGVPEVAAAIDRATGLDLRGVMAVAPLGVDPGPAFGMLAEVAERVRARYPGAAWISAGMSGDLEAAIGAGATHVRVGSAVLGSRPPLR
jgi:PLP dependent protein